MFFYFYTCPVGYTSSVRVVFRSVFFFSLFPCHGAGDVSNLISNSRRGVNGGSNRDALNVLMAMAMAMASSAQRNLSLLFFFFFKIKFRTSLLVQKKKKNRRHGVWTRCRVYRRGVNGGSNCDALNSDRHESDIDCKASGWTAGVEALSLMQPNDPVWFFFHYCLIFFFFF